MILLLWLLCCASAAVGGVWPIPQHFEASGEPVPVAPTFEFVTSSASRRLAKAVDRHTSYLDLYLQRRAEGGLEAAAIEVESSDESLSMATDYSYTVAITPTQATVRAKTVYGAMYGLETFTQLIASGGGLPHSTITIRDAPRHQWRGLMIDSGRRFFPVPLVENLLDAMAANKLNVLHLHASDWCRFGVESKTFPNLTDSLKGIMAGHYSQEDIKGLTAYAKDRGIRLVPEFDVPGHSKGFLPLKDQGLQYCSTSDGRFQLYGDAQNRTYSLLTKVFTEMAELFEDEVFNIGCDETASLGVCTVETTFALERAVLDFISSSLHKTPAGWEEILFDAGAATKDTIVDAWSRHHPSEIIAKGFRAINSDAAHLYFTHPAPGGPDGWSKCWFDVTEGTNSTMFLGAEMSMWTDTYCYIDQCLFPSKALPVAHQLFDPKLDSTFAKSVAGMIWPRGFVAAGAFWNYNASVDPASSDFVQTIWEMNDMLSKRGVLTCPTNCSCDQLHACGKPYLS